MYETHQKGEIASCEVQRRAIEKGFIVSKPTTEARYDLLLDDGLKIHRVQVKYADAEGTDVDSTELDLRKECRNNGKSKVYTKDEIDLVLVYVPRIDNVICLGPELFHNRKTITVRFAPSGKYFGKKQHFANDLIW
jgi:hypothetical protein